MSVDNTDRREADTAPELVGSICQPQYTSVWAVKRGYRISSEYSSQKRNCRIASRLGM